MYKESKDGKLYGEAGWLLDHDRALTSRCVLLRDGTVEASKSTLPSYSPSAFYSSFLVGEAGVLILGSGGILTGK